MLNIFMSESVEDDVRKSAAEQLSVMLHGMYVSIQWRPDNFHKKYAKMCELSRMYELSIHQGQWRQWGIHLCEYDCANYPGCANKRGLNYPGHTVHVSKIK